MFRPVSTQVDFSKLERELLEKWYKEGIVKKYLHRNDKSSKLFSFLDGPITANNPMGMHHGWGRSYKDLWQRFYNMRGYKQRFQNGFDCQGLWVEVEVEKELGIKNKKDIENLVAGNKKASIAKFVELCKERVRKFSSVQTEQSKRLGYFMNWDKSYFTMSDENNYMIWHFLKTCYERSWIYKGHESVPWCPRCETAISQHEMLTEDYKEVVHESIYFELPIVGRKQEYLLVWTTTPWTIPANIAVAVDKKLDYTLVQGNTGDLFWVAQNLIEKVFKGAYKKIVKTVKGEELVGLRYQGPFDDLPAVSKVAKENPKTFHTVIPTDEKILPISTEEGTGFVHTAVSAGVEDFKLGKKLGLPLIAVIADNADYLPGLGFLTGQNAKKNPRIILDFLLEKEKQGGQWVFEIHNYKHRYPACWRCKTELVWKVTDEWYIAMDQPSRKATVGECQPLHKATVGECQPSAESDLTLPCQAGLCSGNKLNKADKGFTLREQMIEVAKMIDWRPAFGLERELDWLSNMHDWLISKKNRYWGLALPIYECKSCGNFEVIGSRDELKEKAIAGWDEFENYSPHKPFIDEVKIKCKKCSKEVSRIDDVGNPWLDAGIVPFSTYIDPSNEKLSYTSDKKYWQEWFPADFITESFPGQFKNWFYSLIAMSTVLEKKNPFKTVLGFASMLGEDGRPMHKSWGNAIEFNEGADKIGVDVMRWMYLSSDPEQNLLFGYKKADETRRRFHLMLWNVYNFFVTYANIDKPKLSPNGKNLDAKNILDEWILARLNQTIETVTNALEKYDAKTACQSLENFVNDLSVWYVRRSRNRVGPLAENKKDRDSCYQTLYEVLINIAKLLAPFNPFIADEIYTNLTGEESVHLAKWPDKKLKVKPACRAGRSEELKLIRDMEMVRKIVELGHAKRKELGIRVRQPLRKLKVKNEKLKVGGELVGLIKDELNVKEVSFVDGDGELKVDFDLEITDSLKKEGEARDLIRQIQGERKKLGTKLDEEVDVYLHTWPVDFESEIKKKALVRNLIKADKFYIKRINE